ncbi:hypothetical protein CVT26_012283 [Gymnopilus dilepis]|uniref:Uncharacterized protein n=1 Tax=Gymnopilus dilepis TaxID=231916 RepID=A0A409YC69_9AGAR|nr:hypothetical protein CVT26_012283 [Gymnopilus dilepis]
MDQINVPLNNLRAHYQVLCDDVRRALHTQAGDAERLAVMRREVLRFYEAAEVHRQSFPAEEWVTLDQSVKAMTTALDDACSVVADPPEGDPLVVVELLYTGRPGRPKIHIRPEFLEEAARFRGPRGIGAGIGCNPRTVRRRIVENGLAPAGEAVFEYSRDENGNLIRRRTGPHFKQQTLNDEELDMAIHRLLQRFPNMGQIMLHGALINEGEVVTQQRVAESGGFTASPVPIRFGITMASTVGGLPGFRIRFLNGGMKKFWRVNASCWINKLFSTNHHRNSYSSSPPGVGLAPWLRFYQASFTVISR